MQRFLIRLALQNVFKRRLRAFLTIGGVAMSTTVMVLLFGLSSGLENMVTAQIDKTAQRNVITVGSKNTKVLKINDKAVTRFQSISGVTSVDKSISLSGQVTYNGISLTIPVYGVTSGYFQAAPITKVAGEVEGKLSGESRAIVLSSSALKAFNLDNSVVGKKVNLALTINQDNDSDQTEFTRQVTARDFVVAGVIDKGTSLVGYMPAEFLIKQGVDNYSEAVVRVAYPEKVPVIRESIEQLGYQTTNVQDSINQVERIFKIISSILIVFAIITTLITVFGTVNTITIELVEATKQIGFLRIFGIKSSDVGRLFMIQSIILAVSGVIIGVVFGVIAGILTNGAIKAAAAQGPTLSDGSIYAYQIPVWQIIIMVMLAVILGWAIGLLPAKRAVTINPLEALKS
ncbi:MAG: hypothetical protein JWP13_914 [Candidatus Saccharibacteria bacterium]|nr:hypothetical protein [Candidatus Saccharibacteria bacterium]